MVRIFHTKTKKNHLSNGQLHYFLINMFPIIIESIPHMKLEIPRSVKKELVFLSSMVQEGGSKVPM